MRLFAPSLIAAAAVLSWTAAVSAQAVSNAGIEQMVREAFAHAPEMIAVAKCESGYRQFLASGNVVRGGPSGQYVGIFQIDVNIHTARALSLGHDILTIEGNIGFAKQLYSERGGAPWKGCLPKTTPAPAVSVPGSPAPVVSGALTLDLRAGMSHDQVRLIQQLLNKAGFPVAASGPGSPGNETRMFGALTREAVRKFQCAKNIACSGSEATTGYGRVGPKTRAALNQIASSTATATEQ